MILDEEYSSHSLSNHTLLGKVLAKALGLSQISIKTSLRQKFSSLYTAKRDMLKDLSQESEKLKEMNKTHVKNVFITGMKLNSI